MSLHCFQKYIIFIATPFRPKVFSNDHIVHTGSPTQALHARGHFVFTFYTEVLLLHLKVHIKRENDQEVIAHIKHVYHAE